MKKLNRKYMINIKKENKRLKKKNLLKKKKLNRLKMSNNK